jgi:hypothetical protein
MTSTSTPPGWYPDTHAPGQQRYWDGNAWTDQTAPADPHATAPQGPAQPPVPTDARDAKARAKADKAYAKASRPWYKKKRFIVPGALLVLIVIIAATSGGGGGDNGTVVSDSTSTSGDKAATDDEGSADEGSASKGSADNPYKVGQTVALEGTEYTVTGARTQKKVGGIFGEKAAGVFVVVDLTIENKKNETKTFMDEAATFIAADETEYSGSDAAIYLDNSLWLTDMQPDLPIDGQLLFDVPPTKVAGGLVRVEDLFGGGEAYIDLGLK